MPSRILWLAVCNDFDVCQSLPRGRDSERAVQETARKGVVSICLQAMRPAMERLQVTADEEATLQAGHIVALMQVEPVLVYHELAELTHDQRQLRDFFAASSNSRWIREIFSSGRFRISRA